MFSLFFSLLLLSRCVVSLPLFFPLCNSLTSSSSFSLFQFLPLSLSDVLSLPLHPSIVDVFLSFLLNNFSFILSLFFPALRLSWPSLPHSILPSPPSLPPFPLSFCPQWQTIWPQPGIFNGFITGRRMLLNTEHWLADAPPNLPPWIWAVLQHLQYRDIQHRLNSSALYDRHM